MIKLDANAFLVGDEPTLEAVLANREARVSFQKRLLQQFPGSSVISFKLNIAGPVKNNAAIRAIFSDGNRQFLELAKSWTLLYNQAISGQCGPEAFYVVRESGIKEALIQLEDLSHVNRLFDFDMINASGKTISRSDLGYGERKCLICDENAKVCGRSRSHPVSALHAKMITDLIGERSDVFYE